jgi:hypothetical protein
MRPCSPITSPHAPDSDPGYRLDGPGTALLYSLLPAPHEQRATAARSAAHIFLAMRRVPDRIQAHRNIGRSAQCAQDDAFDANRQIPRQVADPVDLLSSGRLDDFDHVLVHSRKVLLTDSLTDDSPMKRLSEPPYQGLCPFLAAELIPYSHHGEESR